MDDARIGGRRYWPRIAILDAVVTQNIETCSRQSTVELHSRDDGRAVPFTAGVHCDWHLSDSRRARFWRCHRGQENIRPILIYAYKARYVSKVPVLLSLFKAVQCDISGSPSKLQYGIATPKLTKMVRPSMITPRRPTSTAPK